MPRPRTIEDETLLPNAMQVFWQNGYARTGIRELEQALGMKAPSIYNRFESKEGLFRAALEQHDYVLHRQIVAHPALIVLSLRQGMNIALQSGQHPVVRARGNARRHGSR